MLPASVPWSTVVATLRSSFCSLLTITTAQISSHRTSIFFSSPHKKPPNREVFRRVPGKYTKTAPAPEICSYSRLWKRNSDYYPECE